MNVYMLKDVENVGMNGQIVKVSDGYGTNYLIPQGFAKEVREAEMPFYKNRVVQQKVTAEVLTSKVAMLAERIKALHVTIKKTVHDNGKLYGAISVDEIVDCLKEKEITIDRKQVEFEKAIKTTGEYQVAIKLSSKFKPKFTLKVVESK